MMRERQLDPATVDIAGEVEQMRLGDESILVLECRAHADVRHREVFASRLGRTVVEETQLARIDTRRGQNLVLGFQVRRRKTEPLPASLPFDDPPACRVVAAQHREGLFDSPLREHLPDPRRVDVARIHGDFGDDRHREAELRPQFGQQAHRAFTIAAEMEVVAYVDFDGVNPLVQHLANEVFRGCLRKLVGERLDDDGIDAGFAQQLDPLIDRRQQSRRTLRGQHLARVRIEGVRHRLAAELPCALDDRFDDRSMADVQTIEIPDGDHRVIERAFQLLASANVVQC